MIRRKKTLLYLKSILCIFPPIIAVLVIFWGERVLQDFRLILISFALIIPAISYAGLGASLDHSNSLPSWYESAYRLPSETLTAKFAGMIHNRTKFSIAAEPEDLEKVVYDSMILLALPILVLSTSVLVNVGGELPLPDVKSALLGTGSLILALGSFREADQEYRSITGGSINTSSKIQGIFEKGIGFSLVSIGFLVSFYDIVYELAFNLPTSFEYRNGPIVVAFIIVSLLAGMGAIARLSILTIYLISIFLVSVGASVVFGQLIGISMLLCFAILSILFLL